MTQISINSLTKKAIKAYTEHRFSCVALNGITITGDTIKLYIFIRPEDEKNYLICSWEYADNMWKMNWDITVSKEGIVHDNPNREWSL